MKTREEVINVISKVKHPAIDFPLTEICIVKNLNL